MTRFIWVFVFVGSCSSVDPSEYRTLDSNYGRTDGWRLDRNNEVHAIINGESIAQVSTDRLRLNDLMQSCWGDDDDACCSWDTSYTPDSLVCTLPQNAGLGIGYGTVVKQDSIAIGEDASADAKFAVVIGDGANTVSQSSVVIGHTATCTATGGSNIVIGGTASGLTSGNNIAIGSQAETTSTGGVAIGVTSAAGTSSYALGQAATAPSSRNVAVGHSAVIGDTSTEDAVALGASAAVGDSASSGIAIGHDSVVDDNHAVSVAIGLRATTTAANQIMIGGSTSNLNMVVYGTIQPISVTADPCAGKTEGSVFYNDTADILCLCDGNGDDVKVSDGAACF